MTFIYYKKAYDMCVTMCGISPTIIDLFEAFFE